MELYTSIDGILRAVPKMNWDWAATWSRLAVMRVHLFIDRASYDRGGIERSYASKAAILATLSSMIVLLVMRIIVIGLLLFYHYKAYLDPVKLNILALLSFSCLFARFARFRSKVSVSDES